MSFFTRREAFLEPVVGEEAVKVARELYEEMITQGPALYRRPMFTEERRILDMRCDLSEWAGGDTFIVFEREGKTIACFIDDENGVRFGVAVTDNVKGGE